MMSTKKQELSFESVALLAKLIQKIAVMGHDHAIGHDHPDIERLYELALFRATYWQGRLLGATVSKTHARDGSGAASIVSNLPKLFKLLDSVPMLYATEGIVAGYTPIALNPDDGGAPGGDIVNTVHQSHAQIWREVLALIPRTEYKDNE